MPLHIACCVSAIIQHIIGRSVEEVMGCSPIYADEQMLRYLIREAGFTPQQRDILYAPVNREEATAGDASQSTPLGELTVAIAD